VAFGATNTINCWNSAGGTGRCLAITTSSSGEKGGITINGRDFYGYKVSETLFSTDATRASTNSSGITLTTQKAFKYVTSMIMSTTTTSTGIGVGTTDTYGLPLYCGFNSFDLRFFISTNAYNSAYTALTSNTLVLGTTVTQTSTTGDVRGTIASTTPSDGTVRIMIEQLVTALQASVVTNTDTSGIFGVTQYSAI
jgi:hypothetical protein